MSQVTKEDLLELKRDLILHIDTKFQTLRCAEHEQFLNGLLPRVRQLENLRYWVAGLMTAFAYWVKIKTGGHP